MRRLKFTLLAAGMAAMAMVMGGCSLASQVEDQAYVLVMGLDRASDGNLEMSIQIPKISGGSGDNSTGGGGSESYMQLSVSAADYEAALEMLDWASPRDVNLAQMKLLVLSQELAEEASCGELIENIAQTERLFTATKVAVCAGSAKDFVAAIQPYIGTRISTDIEAMFDHYNDQGYVPVSSLAELYYQTESVYSDPMITYALLDEKSLKKQQDQAQAQPASALSGPVREVSAAYESEIPTRYLGAAVFSDGSLCGILSGNETIMANLLRNELDAFRYECSGQNLELVPTRPAYISVDTKASPVEITVNIRLSYAAQEEIPDEGELQRRLEADIRNVIYAAQEMNAEPFGFSEKAAKSFWTLEDWVEYGWKDRFRDAQIKVKLRFAQSDT